MKNWKTTYTQIGVAVAALLGSLAIIPAQLGLLSTLMPEKWKPWVFGVAAVAAFILRVTGGKVAADADTVKRSQDAIDAYFASQQKK